MKQEDAQKIKNEDKLQGLTIENPPSINIESKKPKKAFSVRSGSKQGSRQIQSVNSKKEIVVKRMNSLRPPSFIKKPKRDSPSQENALNERKSVIIKTKFPQAPSKFDSD